MIPEADGLAGTGEGGQRARQEVGQRLGIAGVDLAQLLDGAHLSLRGDLDHARGSVLEIGEGENRGHPARGVASSHLLQILRDLTAQIVVATEHGEDGIAGVGIGNRERSQTRIRHARVARDDGSSGPSANTARDQSMERLLA